jgi:hypothetical protein
MSGKNDDCISSHLDAGPSDVSHLNLRFLFIDFIRVLIFESYIDHPCYYRLVTSRPCIVDRPPQFSCPRASTEVPFRYLPEVDTLCFLLTDSFPARVTPIGLTRLLHSYSLHYYFIHFEFPMPLRCRHLLDVGPVYIASTVSVSTWEMILVLGWALSNFRNA